MKKKINFCEKIDKNLMAAFGIPVLLMLVLFMIQGIYPFGTRSFLYMDMYHQYMPFFSEFVDRIRAGEGMAHTWDVGIGSNYLALYGYYLASPLHWLAFLFPKKYLLEFMSYLVIVKIGLCGLTSCIYLRKKFNTESFVMVLVSCMYAMSGFMAAYNWNIMWLDCVILFPLILLGLESLIKEGKWVLYCISLALSIFTNFYISIMICIFLVIYFIFQWFAEKGSLRAIIDFAIFSLLAGGMAAVLLVPEVCAILATDFGDISFPKEWETYFPILDVLSRHSLLTQAHRQLDHWPNIFCGSAVLFMLPLYATSKGIPAKRKLTYLALAGILLMSFSANIPDFIWHGMNYPDSLPARQSFIYIFMILIMCADAFLHIKESGKEKVLRSYLIGVGFLLFCEKFAPAEYFTPLVMWMTLLFMTLYAAVAYYYCVDDKQEWKKALGILLVILVVFENGINTVNTSLGTVSREGYLGKLDEYQMLYEEAKALEEGFFRVEKFERTTKNDGTLAGYPTASVFSSTLNSTVANLYEELGMRHSKVYYAYDGATPLTSAMLNVNYLFGVTENQDKYDRNEAEDRLYTAISEADGITLYQSNYTLPFGYVVNDDWDLTTSSSMDPIAVQNSLVKDLGIKGSLFEKKNTEQDQDDVKLKITEDGYYYMVVNSTGNSKINAQGPYGEKKFTDLKRNCILYAGYFTEGEVIQFTNGDDEDTTPKIKLKAYRLQMDVLKEVIQKMGASHMENIVYDSDHISGNITLSESGKIILSVPYEKGWSVYVNGEKYETGLFGDSFMTISLDAGEYEIEMDYVPHGKEAGICLSLISILAFGICLFLRRKWIGYRNDSKQDETTDVEIQLETEVQSRQDVSEKTE